MCTLRRLSQIRHPAFFLLLISLCLPSHALPTESENDVSAALIQAADLGSDAKTNFSISDSKEFALGVVVSEAKGKMLILRKQNSGKYKLEAESAIFENNFGPRYYIEIVQNSGTKRFSIQVNSHAACGIQVETFRFSFDGATWRVAGYDKAEPDTITCDVNLRSRAYSANLLSRRVDVIEYRSGKVVKRLSRLTKNAAPMLSSFNFTMFENEP